MFFLPLSFGWTTEYFSYCDKSFSTKWPRDSDRILCPHCYLTCTCLRSSRLFNFHEVLCIRIFLFMFCIYVFFIHVFRSIFVMLFTLFQYICMIVYVHKCMYFFMYFICAYILFAFVFLFVLSTRRARKLLEPASCVTTSLVSAEVLRFCDVGSWMQYPFTNPRF